MRAMTFTEPGKMKTIDIPEPEMGSEDVLIDMRYVGLCGTDLSTYRGVMPLVKYPLIPGHETSGVILATGPQAPASFRVGDQVTVSPYTPCGTCPACRKGRFNTCERNRTLGVHVDGALTARIAVPYRKVFPSQDLSLKELALVEPLSVGCHATNRGEVAPDETVLVLGCGAIGIGVIAAAVSKGARVIAVDIEDAKLELARSFGVKQTINAATDDAGGAVAELTNGEGVDVAIEAVGHPATIQLAIEASAYAGRAVLIGYTNQEVVIDTNLAIVKELNVMGSRNALNEFPAVIEMLEQRRLPFPEIISATYPFGETAAAFSDWDAAPVRFVKIMIAINM